MQRSDWPKEITRSFLQFDTSSKGYLTRHELRAVYISLLGHAPSLVELDAALPKSACVAPEYPGGAAGGGGGAGIELPAVCDFMSRKLASMDPDEVVRRAFRVFDTKHKGYVSLGDLEMVMAEVAPHLPSQTISMVFSQLDQDRDGRVSYRDFHTMMTARVR